MNIFLELNFYLIIHIAKLRLSFLLSVDKIFVIMMLPDTRLNKIIYN